MAKTNSPLTPAAAQPISNAKGLVSTPWYTWFQSLLSYLPSFPLTVANGGTGLDTLTAHGVLVGQGTDPVSAVNPAGINSGVPLINQSGADPIYGTALVIGGGTGQTILAANNLIIGNGTSAAAFLAPGAAGHLVVSDGTHWAATNLIAPPPSIEAGAVGSGTFSPAGLINSQFNGTGSGNATGTGNTTLFTYSLPANSLDAIGRGVKFKAWGFYASNGNDKTIQLLVNSTVVVSSAVVSFSAGWWRAEAEIYKNLSSTQIGTGQIITKNSVIGPIDILTSATDTSAITLSVTGASPTTGAANDVVAIGWTVEFLN